MVIINFLEVLRSKLLSIFVYLIICKLLRSNAAIPHSQYGCVGDYGNYTKGSSYETNLNLLFSKLSSQASLTKFQNSTSGNYPNKVYGLFQCREDFSQDVCKQCVSDASKSIIQKCPFYGEAILWYDECMLRYSNHSFFALYEVYPTARVWTTSEVPNYDKFAPIFAKTMDGLISETAYGKRSSHFATREANVTQFDKLYCLAQCTPDINGFGCNRCLKAALHIINDCCKQSIRAVAFMPSCQLRYDMSRFYNETELDQFISVTSPSNNTTFIRQEKGPKSSIIVGISIAASVGLGFLLLGVWLCVKQKKATKTCVETANEQYKGIHEEIEKDSDDGDNLRNEEFVRYDFASLMSATRKFSDDNKLGEGGFGVVYKGKLRSGQEVAIKRLSSDSRQGAKEFMTEARIVAKLQHKNLVKLLGFCSEEEEKLLVYEFMPNTSLDRFLFDPSKRGLLNWEIRYKIIMGITKGLQYLHEDSRLTVIHRDLKTSNILLDSEMNAKIADFGLAKLFGGDEKLGNTSRIAGTHGYMAPEYLFTGEYSNKSDVYSFGVIILEIVSGRKNKIYTNLQQYEDLPTYAWRLWNEGQSFKLVDPQLHENCSRNEVLRCIQIGILCVQENAVHRPTMATVALMLTGSIAIPSPSPPAVTSQNFGIRIDDNYASGSTDQKSKGSIVQSTTSVSSNTEVEQDLYPR